MWYIWYDMILYCIMLCTYVYIHDYYCVMIYLLCTYGIYNPPRKLDILTRSFCVIFNHVFLSSWLGNELKHASLHRMLSTLSSISMSWDDISCTSWTLNSLNCGQYINKWTLSSIGANSKTDSHAPLIIYAWT